MRIVLDPPRGVQVGTRRLGIGATRGQALDTLAAVGEVTSFQRGKGDPVALMAAGPTQLAVFAYFDERDAVEAIEVARPTSDAGVRVEFRGVDVFAPADSVIAELARRCELEVDAARCTPTAHDLMLGLWRDGPDDESFETVIVARPGYDDAAG